MKMKVGFLVLPFLFVEGNVPELYKSWKQIDVEAFNYREVWGTGRTAEQGLKRDKDDGDYVINNNVICGIKVWEDRVFVSLPRWRTGVPVTLAELACPETTKECSPAQRELRPFPFTTSDGLNLQSYGKHHADLNPCKKIRYVQSMEIDPDGMMWILDVGRVNIFPLDGDIDNSCPPKMVIWDIVKNRKVQEYTFPDGVFHYESSFPNDLVLDVERDYAYITDTDQIQGGIVVLKGMKTKGVATQSWRVEHAESMSGSGETISIDELVLGPGQGPTSTDGIALTADGETLVYTPLQGYNLYTIDTHILREKPETQLLTLTDKQVTNLGRKVGWNDGMTMSAQGRLYFGSFQSKQLWSMNGPGIESQGLEPHGRDPMKVQEAVLPLNWIDTFAWGENGVLWFTTNQLHKYFHEQYDSGNPLNMAIWRMETNENGYLEREKMDGECLKLWKEWHLEWRGTGVCALGDGASQQDINEKLHADIEKLESKVDAIESEKANLEKSLSAAKKEEKELEDGLKVPWIKDNFLIWFILMWVMLLCTCFFFYTTHRLADGNCCKHCLRMIYCQCRMAFVPGHGVRASEYRDIGDGGWGSGLLAPVGQTYLPMQETDTVQPYTPPIAG